MQLQVYLAGPITGQPEKNRAAFRRAAEVWRTRGWIVFDPVEEDDKHPDEALSLAGYMKRDLPFLCDSAAIALLPGWRESVGAKIELGVAEGLGLRVFDANYPAAHPITDHEYIEGTNVCCFAPDYMHLRGWGEYR